MGWLLNLFIAVAANIGLTSFSQEKWKKLLKMWLSKDVTLLVVDSVLVDKYERSWPVQTQNDTAVKASCRSVDHLLHNPLFNFFLNNKNKKT